MMYKMEVTLIYSLLTVLVTLTSSLELPKLPCELSWQVFNSGDSIPSEAVYTEPKTYYVVRAEINNITTRVGFFNVQTQKVHIPLMSELGFQGPDSTSVEILTNPNKCELIWEDIDSKYISASKFPNNTYTYDDENFVGKTVPQEGLPSLSGHIDFNAGGIYVLDSELIYFSRQFKILVSQTSDIEMEIKDFIFDQETSGASHDVLGLDEIANDAEVTVVQKIIHSKIITERFQFKVDVGMAWLIAGKLDINIWINLFFILNLFVKVPIRWAAAAEVTGGFIIDTVKETEVKVERQIIVPPSTSIRACSSVSLQESSAMNWRAKVYYTAAGLNATKILPIVLEQGITGAYLYEGSVVKDITGVFQGSMVMDSEFTVVDASDTEECIF